MNLTAVSPSHPATTLSKSQTHEQQQLLQVRKLATLLDSAYRVPGTNFRVGWDSLLGLIPGVGDAVTGLASAAILGYAWKLGVRKRVLARMLANVGVDVAVGAIPVVGEIFDATFKANNRNVALIERELGSAKRVARK